MGIWQQQDQGGDKRFWNGSRYVPELNKIIVQNSGLQSLQQPGFFLFKLNPLPEKIVLEGQKETSDFFFLFFIQVIICRHINGRIITGLFLRYREEKPLGK